MFLPLYGIICLLSCFLFNDIIYFGIQKLYHPAHIYDFSILLDDKISFVPQFIYIYLGCYVFWALNYILIAKQGKKECFQFTTSDLLSRIVCGICFVVIPSTLQRPDIVNTDLTSRIVAWLYQTDAPSNLLPSVHCLVSWFCFVGVRDKKGIPLWYKCVSLILAILVFASVLYVKQHVFLDVVTGVLLCEVCYFIGKHTHAYIYLMKLYDKTLGAHYE